MLNRRAFLSRLTASTASLRRLLPGQSGPAAPEWEYVVVGSGAGGGTVAARLAELGHTVFLLEAGGDPALITGGDPLHPDRNTFPEDYEVPAFHASSTENEATKWDFFVRHYAATERQKQDPKYYENYEGHRVDGVLYPRAGALGGCTTHNAMILMYPQNADWEHIANETGDDSWKPEHMRGYFEKMENCHYRPIERFFQKVTHLNLTRHGFGGWLHTEKGAPFETAIQDQPLLKTLLHAIQTTIRETPNAGLELLRDLETQLDPNDWAAVKANLQGIHYTPLTTQHHARTGTRERLLDVRRRFPERLHIEFDALATRVIVNGQKRATGVEYRSGSRLYRPHGQPGDRGAPRTVVASREVILCGGAFNTPQLLMLSGIGPQSQLNRWGIPPVKVLEGVGRNLQDRYEVGVVHRMKQSFQALAGATFTKGDGPYEQWRKHRKGIYESNGALLGVTRQSANAPAPDLFCFGLVGNFHGYYPGYSKLAATQHDQLTWAILKAHTENRGGEVTLRSADPLVSPDVNFHYFEEGTDKAGADLDAVVEGIRFVRRLTAGLEVIKSEEMPGSAVQTDDELKEYVRNNAWGHHASCTCRIGKESDNGVLDSRFRVHGVAGLRVVDASIFPRIPGFFIVSAIYIAAEKAADVIHRS